MNKRSNNLLGLEDFDVPTSDESIFHSDSYAEMVEEIENVSEELQRTRHELWDTQLELKESNKRIEILETRLTTSDMDHANVRIMQKEQRAFLDTQERLYEEVAMLKDRNGILQGSERQLKKAVELLQKDLANIREKHRNSESIVRSLNVKITKMEANGNELGVDVKETRLQLKTREEELKEAREETTKLVEEVASLQEELRHAKRAAEGKEEELKEKVAKQYKERLTLEVRNLVTKQVTLKVTREVKAEMKAEREKEINTIRDQLKKVFKENAVLSERVEVAEAKAAETEKLEEKVPELRYEVSRLESVLETTKKEQEVAIGELESYFRIKVQGVREEAAKEKWASITEMRQQMAKEREREARDFGSRLEALSRETDKLLAEAAREKDEYGNQIKQRITEDKQREIDKLKEKLQVTTKESEEKLKESQVSKVQISEKIRKEVAEDRQQEISKYKHRIDTLLQEKEALEKRIDAYEDELNWTWQENETNADQLKSSQHDLKVSEDELFKLKRKSHNLNTLVERYKKDNMELSNELKHSKQLFSEALEISEKNAQKLGEKVQSLENATEKTTSDSSEISKELARAKESLAASEKEVQSLQTSLAALEKVASNLKEEKQKLGALIETSDSKASKELEECKQQFKEQLDSSEAEKSKLKEKLQALDPLLEKYKNDFAEISEEFETATRRFKGALMASENEIVLLKENIKDLNLKIERYRNQDSIPDKTEMSEQPAKSEKDADEAGDENLKLQNTIRSLHSRLEEFRDQDSKTDKLRAQIRDLKNLLDTYCIEHAELADILDFARHRDESTQMDSDDDAAMIKEKFHRFGTVLRTYKQKSAAASKELEHSRLRFKEALLESEKETIQYKERVLNLNSVLTMYKDKHTEATKELALSKEQLRDSAAASEEQIGQLKKSIQGLERLVAGSQEDRSQFESDLLRSKHQLEEDLKESRDEVSELRENTRNMEDLLEQLQKQHSALSNELRNSAQSFENSKVLLERTLKDSQSEVARLKESSRRMESFLEQTQKEHSDTSKELMLSKRLFNEELMKSEETIFKLKAKVENLESSLQQTKSDYLAASKELELSRHHGQKEAAAIENVTILNLKETIANLESQLQRSNDQHSENTKLLEQSKQRLKSALSASEDEALSQKSAIQTLKLQLEKSKQEKFKLSKELQQSMQLFNETLVAWREETRVLKEQQNESTDGNDSIESPRFGRSPTGAAPASHQHTERVSSYRPASSDASASDAQSIEEGTYLDAITEDGTTIHSSVQRSSKDTTPNVAEQVPKTTGLGEGIESKRPDVPQADVEDGSCGGRIAVPTEGKNRDSSVHSEDNEETASEEAVSILGSGKSTISDPSANLGTSMPVREKSNELIWFRLDDDSVSSRRWGGEEQVEKWREDTRTLIEELEAAKEHRQKNALPRFEDQPFRIGEISQKEPNASDAMDASATNLTRGSPPADTMGRDLENSNMLERGKRVSWKEAENGGSQYEQLMQQRPSDSEGKLGGRKHSDAPSKFPEEMKSSSKKAVSWNKTTPFVATSAKMPPKEAKVKSEVDTLSESENSTIEETVGSSRNSLAGSHQSNVDMESSITSPDIDEGTIKRQKNTERKGDKRAAETGADEQHDGPTRISKTTSGDSEDSDGSTTRRMMINWETALDDFSAALQEDGSSCATRSRLEFSSGSSSEGVLRSAKNKNAVNQDESDFSLNEDGSSLSEFGELKSSLVKMFRPIKKKMVTWQEPGEYESQTRDPAPNTDQAETNNDDSITSSRGGSLGSSLKGEHLALTSDVGHNMLGNISIWGADGHMEGPDDMDSSGFESRDETQTMRSEGAEEEAVGGSVSEQIFETSSLDETIQYNYVSPASSFEGTNYHSSDFKMMRSGLIEGRSDSIAFLSAEVPEYLPHREGLDDSEDRKEARDDDNSESLGEDGSVVSEDGGSWISSDFVPTQSNISKSEVAHLHGSMDDDDISSASHLENRYWDGVLDASLGTDHSADRPDMRSPSSSNKQEGVSEIEKMRYAKAASHELEHSSDISPDEASEIEDERCDEESREKPWISEGSLAGTMARIHVYDSPSNSERQSNTDSETLGSTAERILLQVGTAQYDYWFGRNGDKTLEGNSNLWLGSSTSTSVGTGNALAAASNPHQERMLASDAQYAEADNDSLGAAAEKVLLGIAADTLLGQFRLDAVAEGNCSHLYPDAALQKSRGLLLDSARKVDDGMSTVAEQTGNMDETDLHHAAADAEASTKTDVQVSGFQRSLRQSRLWSRKGLQLRRFCTQKSYQNKVEALTPTAEALEQEQERKEPPSPSAVQDSTCLADLSEAATLPSLSSDHATVTLPSVSSEPTTTSTARAQLSSLSSSSASRATTLSSSVSRE